jgi:hypothetical protein
MSSTMLTLRLIGYVCCVLWLGACVDADARSSQISGAQVLALVARPPDAAPGELVELEVFAVDANGTLTPDDLTLSYCRTPASIGDNRLASDACALTVEDDARIERSQTGIFSKRLPSDACTRFGPSVPATTRAPDPDPTGGYYQPVRIAFGDVQAVGTLRLRCPLANAPFQLTREFRERYAPNQNPVLTPLSMTLGDTDAPVDPQDVPRDADIRLHAGWTPESRESYVVYDAFAGALSTQTEAMRVSWYATQGELTFAHKGSASHERTTTADNTWHSPGAAGTAHLWLVLRDDRGGTAYASYALTLR